MFIGHYGIALAAKKLAPRTSLGTLFLAAQWPDLLWPVLLLAGRESVRIDPALGGASPLVFVSYPWSHSLLMMAVWAAVAGAIVFAGARDRHGALVVAALVVSHWFLDLIVHRPDLPLVPGGALAFGFGIWKSTAATIVLELGLLAAGLLLAVRAAPRLNRWPLWALSASLAAIFVAGTFGPPPPSVAAIAWVGQAQWLFVLAAYWIDRERGRATSHAGSIA